MEKIVQEILNEVKEQKVALKRIQEQLDGYKIRKPLFEFSSSSASLPTNALPFEHIKDNLKKYCPINIADIAFTGPKKYALGFATIMFKIFSQFSEETNPIRVIIKPPKKRTFLLKHNDAWSADNNLNNLLFEEFVAKLIIHFLHSVYAIQQEGDIQIVDATKIINEILKRKKETNFAKTIRSKFLGMFDNKSV
jgi:hypothetical protein